MSSDLPTVWKAEPHTIAKIDMLESYLYVWFSVLGRAFPGQDLWYVDGFAGPSEYINHPIGSPVAALNAAAKATTQGVWRGGTVRCMFIEDDPARFARLQQKLDAQPRIPHVRFCCFQGTFVEGIERLGNQTPNPFSRREPLFVFIDPFGPSDLPFVTVRELLSGPRCEALINLDSDGVSRIYRAGENAAHRANLNALFGDDSWEAELAGSPNQMDAARRIVQLYKQKLCAIPGIDYAFTFEMRKKDNQFDYHLVFATGHPLGLEKMKEVMKKIDQTGAYCFSDAHVGQESLFSFVDAEPAADAMGKHFAGSLRTYGEVEAYALNDSPFPNPKSMLSILETAGRISVHCDDKTRRKGKYPERLRDSIRIQF
jgi:three-Cys-motif partner protein